MNHAIALSFLYSSCGSISSGSQTLQREEGLKKAEFPSKLPERRSNES